MPTIVVKNITKNVSEHSGGIGFLGLLGLLFIALKLTSVISWSWWLVLLPLYGPVALVLGIIIAVLVIGGVIAGIIALVSLFGRKKRKPAASSMEDFLRQHRFARSGFHPASI